MPTWMDFGFKNPPKSALGRLLGRLVAVLGRLEASWKRLNASWHVLETLQEAPERESMNLQWFRGVLAVVDRGGATPAHARAMAAGFGPDP